VVKSCFKRTLQAYFQSKPAQNHARFFENNILAHSVIDSHAALLPTNGWWGEALRDDPNNDCGGD